MLPVTCYNALLLFLWIMPHVLLAVSAVVLYRRGLHREFPCFFAYALYEIAEFILLFTLHAAANRDQYQYAYCVTLLLSIAFRFGVIDEVAKDLFRGSQLLKVTARRSLQGVTVLLLVIGVLLLVYAPGESSARWYAGVFVVNRGAAMVQSGLLLALLLVSRFLGLSWRRPTFGIALGLAVLTSLDLATFALRATFTSAAAKEILNLQMTGAYLICVLIWIGYLLAPDPRPASLAVLPRDLAALPRDEVEIWNTAFQHLLRD